MVRRLDHTHFPTTHVNCRVSRVCDSVIGLELRQCSLHHVHHYPCGPPLDNFALGGIFQRCSVRRSLSGVALLPEATNAGGYRSCQHSWLLRALLLTTYAARAPSPTSSGPAPRGRERAARQRHTPQCGLPPGTVACRGTGGARFLYPSSFLGPPAGRHRRRFGGGGGPGVRTAALGGAHLAIRPAWWCAVGHRPSTRHQRSAVMALPPAGRACLLGAHHLENRTLHTGDTSP